MKHNKMFQAHLSRVMPDVKKETEWSAQIVDRIDSLLKEKGLTHRELAARIGCNETQIVRWTRGFPNYTLSTLAKLSIALGEDLIKVACSSTVVSGYQSLQTYGQHYLSDSEPQPYGSTRSIGKKSAKSSKKLR